MAEKEFIVSHAKARAPITITGKNLEEALEKEGLNPAIWKEVISESESEVEETGNNKGDAGPETD